MSRHSRWNTFHLCHLLKCWHFSVSNLFVSYVFSLGNPIHSVALNIAYMLAGGKCIYPPEFSCQCVASSWMFHKYVKINMVKTQHWTLSTPNLHLPQLTNSHNGTTIHQVVQTSHLRFTVYHSLSIVWLVHTSSKTHTQSVYLPPSSLLPLQFAWEALFLTCSSITVF